MKQTNPYCLLKFLYLSVVSRDTCVYDFNILLKTQVYSKQDKPCIGESEREGMPFIKQFDL